MNKPVSGGWFAGTVPRDLGVTDGRLRPCPDTPNCVSSHGAGRDAIPPLAVPGEAISAWRRLAEIVAAMPRTRIAERNERYLRVEFASRIFGFVDDVEFLLDADAGVIHVRSASRLGYSDLGVNRSRVEDIRRHFSDSGAKP